MVTRKWDNKGKDYILVYTEEEKQIIKLQEQKNAQYQFLKYNILIPFKSIDLKDYSELNDKDIKYKDETRGCFEMFSLKNGIKDGIYRQYYIKKEDDKEEENILILEAFYKEGKLDGKCTVWYPFHKLSVLKECNFIEGQQEDKHNLL
jgi:hypothetical protein